MRIERNKSEPTQVAPPIQPAEPAMASNTMVQPEEEQLELDLGDDTTEVPSDEEDV